MRELLDALACVRPPALRRSTMKGMLYATDVLLCATAEQTERFRMEAEQAGWSWLEQAGWIHLTREILAPPAGWERRETGPEARACRSLLSRQASRLGPTENDAQAELVKAGEEGPAAFERVCEQLHRDWAARLREGRSIPEIDLRFFE